jgi:hypothetical protein
VPGFGHDEPGSDGKVRSPSAFWFVVALFVISGCAQLHAQFADCANCDSIFTLTHADLLCVAKRIDRLLDRPDPVYFDAANCDQGSIKVMSSAIPKLVAPPPSASPVNKWLQLTKQQLQCLRAKLPELESSNGDPLTISLTSSDCLGNKP